ncbi:MAG: NUDIX domain-containing protein [Actinobacteria bacterium]|nr:MAG: NUDIX domain-containing protein [Actinomycetota bacterium]
MTPPLARSGLRRVAHRRSDDAWLADAWARARVLVVDRDHALARGDRLVLLTPPAAPAGDRLFLGEDDEGTPYFAVLAPVADEPGTTRVTLREVGHLLDDLESALLVTAIALRVTANGRTIWPRTDPAVIVLVHDGVPGDDGRCLLGHNVAWTGPDWVRRYSCLAGFVEAGESAEAAVVREVAEEVGVPVHRLRYVGSQAWPYPGSLMLGFTAEGDPGRPVRVDEAEISEARWFSRTEVRDVLEGRRDDFGLPTGSSIAHFLVMEWLAGRA